MWCILYLILGDYSYSSAETATLKSISQLVSGIMWEGDRPPLPEWMQDLYSWLETHIQTELDEDSLDRQQAVELALQAHPEHDLTHDEISYAITQLINRGYLYEVDNRLYITEFRD